MNLLLVITNINGTYDDAYSFGLASIASIARDKGFGYDFSVINTAADQAAFFDAARRLRPRIIAYTSVSSQFIFVRDLSDKIRKEHGDGIIQVCGGVHTTIFPEAVLEATALDGIFIGESDLAFADFLDRVAEGRPFQNIRNFAYSDSGRLVKNELYPLIADLDTLPFPERDRYGYARFIKKDGYASFMFSRGCPFSCSYCSNHAIARAYGMKANTPRYKSPARCIEEIRQLAGKYPIRRVHVGDDTFGLNKNWMREFCARYRAEIALPLVCILRVNLVDKEMMDRLKAAGCVHVNCGVESGNDYIRNVVMKRGITEAQIVDAYALFKKYGISANAINMIGLPHETVATVWDTIRLNRKIDPESTAVNIFYPYRGTDLGDYCFEKGLVDQSEYLGFSKERRDSILDFPPEFKEQLRLFHRDWHTLVYRFRPHKLANKYIREQVRNRFPRFWDRLRSAKEAIRRMGR